MKRLPSTCAALRAARTAAFDLAAEADTDGRHGIARALRRKATAPRPGDWAIVHYARRVEAQIGAYGITATGTRHTTAPPPADDGAAIDLATAATRIVAGSTLT